MTNFRAKWLSLTTDEKGEFLSNYRAAFPNIDFDFQWINSAPGIKPIEAWICDFFSDDNLFNFI